MNQLVRRLPSSGSENRPRLSIAVNLVAPYRIPLYKALGESFDLLVLHEASGKGRSSWMRVDPDIAGVRVKSVMGIRLRTQLKRPGDMLYDYRYLQFPLVLFFELTRFRPRCVISIEMGFRTVIALLYGTLFRVPVWVWWGGTIHTERAISFARKVLRRLVCRWAKRWISYGSTSTEYLLSLGVEKERILQVQNTVDSAHYKGDILPKLELFPKPVLLSVGQLIGRKGFDLFLKACWRLQEKGVEFTILIVGEGPEENKLKQLASDMGLRNLHFCPPVPTAEMPAVYRSADCLVFPTLEDVWGLVVNEALWSGLPVIASKFAGCATELLPPSSVFDPLNEDEFETILARAITRNVESPDEGVLFGTQEVAEMLKIEILGALDAD